MKEKCEILIILPVLNEEKFIERCLKSLLNQDFSNWRVLSQDNFSDDKTSEILDKMSKQDDRISFRRSETRLNPSESFNSCADWALKSVDSKYVMWLSGDDYLDEKEYLTVLIKESSSNKNNLLMTPKFVFQSEDTPINQQVFEMDLYNLKSNKRINNFIKNWLNVCVLYAFYPREVFESTLRNPVSRLSTYLGSDWWWSYHVIKNYNLKNCKITYRKTNHKSGWRHGHSELKSGQKKLIRIFPKWIFFYNHFIKNRKRYTLRDDPWIYFFMTRTIIDMFIELILICKKIFQKLFRMFFLIKKKSA